MHAVKNPAQYVSDPGDAVEHAIMRIARYLLGTASDGLRLYGSKGPVELRVASDADDAGGTSRRSMLCYVSWIGASLDETGPTARRAFFQWNNQWSIPVACGSMESEIYDCHQATKLEAPDRGLLGEIGLDQSDATDIHMDSASAITVL